MYKRIKTLYMLYRKYLADLLFVMVLFGITILASRLPYINVLIANFDPFLTGIVVAWIACYALFRPALKKVLLWALLLLVFSFIFILFSIDIISEMLGSLAFTMVATVVIVDMKSLKKTLSKKR